MTDKPMKVIVDCATNTSEMVELTAEEIAELELRKIQEQEAQAAYEAELEAKLAIKSAALAKLTALGLSEEEAKAIAG